MKPQSKAIIVLSWICRLTAAIILLQTLFFKFTGAEESVYIFTKVGLEPVGRYGTGTVELVAAVLLAAAGTAVRANPQDPQDPQSAARPEDGVRGDDDPAEQVS